MDLPFNFLQLLTWIDFSQVSKVTDAPEELGRLATAVRGHLTDGGEARRGICPYRGLEVFREENSAFFVGRGSADQVSWCTWSGSRLNRQNLLNVSSTMSPRMRACGRFCNMRLRRPGSYATTFAIA